MAIYKSGPILYNQTDLATEAIQMGEKLTITTKKNPIIPRMGVCDPHIHVFNGRLWLYASHDAEPCRGFFCMHDWQIWSTEDAVTWNLEQVVHPEDFFMGKSDSCWAVDCAEKNGQYYYYFSDGSTRTGVAVGNTPAGPFRDVLGKPLLDGTVTPTREYDPTVFQDDDGCYYLAFGGPAWAYGDGCGYFIAKLGDDMMSLAEPPRRIELDHFGDDKASLNKFGGRYYLSYGGYYAVADNIYGPYHFCGHTGSSIDHTSFCAWNGQLFQAITVNDHAGAYRSSGLCYVHIRHDGSLVTDPLIVEYGVGQYDSNWNRIEAEWYMKGEHIEKVENDTLFGFSVACKQRAVLHYPKIRNLKDKVGIVLCGCCVGKATVEVRESGETGHLLGTIDYDTPNNRFWFNSMSDRFFRFNEPLPDVCDLCLVIRPEDGSEYRLDWFHFFAEALENNPAL